MPGLQARMLTSVVAALLCASFLPAVSSSLPSCTKFNFPSPAAALATVCNGAVDYDFYLPANVTLEYLNRRALIELNKTALAILPPSCQSSIKKLACSMVYRKCPAGIDLANYATYNNKIYSDLPFPKPVPLPFQRPCKSVCEAVRSQCYGVLNLLGMNPDCSARYSYYPPLDTYGKPFQYDQSNDTSQCNGMSAQVEVQQTREIYIGAASKAPGACYGLVQEVYVPPANMVNAALAPLQPPYVVQTIIEGALMKNIKALPKWLGADCHFALRKYFCSSAFMRPQEMVIKKVFAENSIPEVAARNAFTSMSVNTSFLNYAFSLPSYPHNDVCKDYQAKCGVFIASAGVAALVPNCSATSDGIAKYPTLNQTITSLPVPVGPGVVNFKTAPNKAILDVPISVSSYTTKCPPGFVIPDNPLDKDVMWIPASGCALPCKSSLWNEDEWSAYETITKVNCGLGLPLIILLLVTLLIDKKKRKTQYLIIFFAFTSMVATLFFVIMSPRSHGEKFCRDNATALNMEDGISLCTFEGGVLMYTALSCCLSWLSQCIDLMLKLVFNIKTEKYWPAYCSLIFLTPIIPTAIAGGNGWYGYSRVLPWCFLSDSVPMPENVDIALFYLPICIISAIGTFAMSSVIFIIVRTVGRAAQPSSDSEKSSSNKLKAKLRAAKIPIIFVGTFLIIWCSLFSYRGITYREATKIAANFKEWISCVFKNFDGTDNSIDVCLRDRVVVAPLAGWIMMCASGQSWLISIVFLTNSDVIKSWYNRIVGRLTESKVYSSSAAGSSAKDSNSLRSSSSSYRKFGDDDALAETEESVSAVKSGGNDIKMVDALEVKDFD